MTWSISPPGRPDSHVMVQLAGASGSGKTYSAMRLATGMTSTKFSVIDTEAKRALHYRDDFNFEHIDFEPPFTPERYVEAMKFAMDQGVEVIIFDSMSHEWDGQGGIMEAADNATSSGGKKLFGPDAWNKPKARHKKMMNAFLQARVHLIFCLRADEKIDMSEKDSRGKMIVKQLGWIPICEKKFHYEMTIRLTFNPTTPGMVDLSLPNKIEDHHRLAFEPGSFITEAGGKLLHDWSKGEEVETPNKELWDSARRIAQEGSAKLATYWKQVATPEDKVNLRVIGHQLRQMADAADKNQEPFG